MSHTETTIKKANELCGRLATLEYGPKIDSIDEIDLRNLSRAISRQLEINSKKI